MKRFVLSALTVCVLGVGLCVMGTTGQRGRGPFNPEAWPTSINPAKKVHYVCTDGMLQPSNANWAANMKILTGGDQPTEAITVGGHQATAKVDPSIAGVSYLSGQNGGTIRLYSGYRGGDNSVILSPTKQEWQGSPCDVVGRHKRARFLSEEVVGMWRKRNRG